jgi:hypothetical protein
MSEKQKESAKKPGISNLKLAIGAASLFLFIVGVKRSFKLDDGAAEKPEPDRGRK